MADHDLSRYRIMASYEIKCQDLWMACVIVESLNLKKKSTVVSEVHNTITLHSRKYTYCNICGVWLCLL